MEGTNKGETIMQLNWATTHGLHSFHVSTCSRNWRKLRDFLASSSTSSSPATSRMSSAIRWWEDFAKCSSTRSLSWGGRIPVVVVPSAALGLFRE